MSALNGDRARFQKDRKRKLRRRQSLRTLASGLAQQKATNQLAQPVMQLAIPQPELKLQTPPGTMGDDIKRGRG